MLYTYVSQPNRERETRETVSGTRMLGQTHVDYIDVWDFASTRVPQNVHIAAPCAGSVTDRAHQRIRWDCACGVRLRFNQ